MAFSMRNFRAIDMPAAAEPEPPLVTAFVRLTVSATTLPEDPMTVHVDVGAESLSTLGDTPPEAVLVVVDYGDGQTQELTLPGLSVEHTYAEPGDYRVSTGKVAAPENVVVFPAVDTVSVTAPEPPPEPEPEPEPEPVPDGVHYLTAELDPAGDGRLDYIVSCIGPGNTLVKITFGNGSTDLPVPPEDPTASLITPWHWGSGGTKTVTAKGDIIGTQTIKVVIPSAITT